jgi:hypothetical protein
MKYQGRSPEDLIRRKSGYANTHYSWTRMKIKSPLGNGPIGLKREITPTPDLLN